MKTGSKSLFSRLVLSICLPIMGFHLRCQAQILTDIGHASKIPTGYKIEITGFSDNGVVFEKYINPLYILSTAYEQLGKPRVVLPADSWMVGKYQYVHPESKCINDKGLIGGKTVGSFNDTHPFWWDTITGRFWSETNHTGEISDACRGNYCGTIAPVGEWNRNSQMAAFISNGKYLVLHNEPSAAHKLIWLENKHEWLVAGLTHHAMIITNIISGITLTSTSPAQWYVTTWSINNSNVIIRTNYFDIVYPNSFDDPLPQISYLGLNGNIVVEYPNSQGSECIVSTPSDWTLSETYPLTDVSALNRIKSNSTYSIQACYQNHNGLLYCPLNKTNGDVDYAWFTVSQLANGWLMDTSRHCMWIQSAMTGDLEKSTDGRSWHTAGYVGFLELVSLPLEGPVAFYRIKANPFH